MLNFPFFSSQLDGTLALWASDFNVHVHAWHGISKHSAFR